MHPTLIRIGNLDIRFYGICIALAFLLGLAVAKRHAREKGIPQPAVENFAFVAMISGVIGARLYYVAFHLPWYLANPLEIPAVWHGGLAIHGGIICGFFGAFLYSRIKKIPFLAFGDLMAAPFILGQAVGRIGNFMNGEVHGVPVVTPWSVIFRLKPAFGDWYARYLTLPAAERLQYAPKVPWGLVFPPSSPAGSEFPGVALHPAMLYESVLNLAGFCLIWFVLRKKCGKKPGRLWWWYLILYSVNRIIVSFFRVEDLMIGPFRAPHAVSALIMVFAALMLARGKEA
ncbi:MAG: prolipoprotein diacylglyceryl transferase [Fusobacteriaceae bacterium]|jgi:phosphatidylglycerol:prolipoprotein diacylglycerol transferase|nr:prolipoprotein diacylglyceryl transferase [Fusobacteriaceae bacterium]